MTDIPAGDVLRPLGAFERTIDLYTHRNPVQFSLAARLARSVSEEALRTALTSLQRAHPLLAVSIQQPTSDDGTPPQAVFRYSARPIPIRVAHGSAWQTEAALEQTTPIRSAPGPLVRCVLVPSSGPGAPATILLTFGHQIIDGRGAVLAMTDLIAALEGEELVLGALPASQESLLVEQAPHDDDLLGESGADGDTHGPAGVLRPFDGAVPTLQTAELSPEDTEALVAAARRHGCTVQAMLCAAAAIALFSDPERPRVRVNVPVDIRSLVGGGHDAAIRFSGATVTLDGSGDVSFWALARDAARQLDEARRPDQLRAAALGLARFAPDTPLEAEAAMLAATSADIEITNLGIADLSPSTVTALWGPTMTTQIGQEQILGVVTQGGALRLVNTTRDPIVGLATRIVEVLTSAGHVGTTSARAGGR